MAWWRSGLADSGRVRSRGAGRWGGGRRSGSGSRDGYPAGALVLRASVVEHPREERIVAGLDGGQIQGDRVVRAAVQQAAVEPQLDARDGELGGDEDGGGAAPGAVGGLEGPAGRGGILEGAVGEVA